MEHTGLSKCTNSFGVALSVACVANALLVTVKEKSPHVLASMKILTGHHWITHCMGVILLFIVLGWGLSKVRGGEGLRLRPDTLAAIVVAGVLLNAFIIVGFYLIVG